MHVSLCTCARTSLSTPAEVECLECRGGAVSASLRIAKLFFEAGVPNNTPDKSCQLLFSLILIKLYTIKLGNCFHSDGYDMLPIVVLMCIYILIYVLSMQISSPRNYIFLSVPDRVLTENRRHT